MNRKLFVGIRVAFIILVAAGALVTSIQYLQSQAPIAPLASGQGKPWVNYTQPREVAGDEMLNEVSALPLSMTAADLDGNGKEDVVVGSLGNQGGVVMVYSDGFEGGRLLFQVPERPDFLEAGDFDRDGTQDLGVITRGSNNVVLLKRNAQDEWQQESIAIDGVITSAGSFDVFQRDGKKDLVLGIRGSKSFELLVYNDGTKQPESISFSYEITALAFGDLTGKSAGSVAAAGLNQITILHKKDDTETVQLPFAVSGLVVGNFLYDRGGRNELGVLASDGSIHIVGRSSLDRRAITDQEKLSIQQNRRQLGSEEFAKFLRSLNKESGATGWKVYESINSVGGNAGPGSLAAARLSGMPTHDLIATSRASGKVEVLVNAGDGRMLGRLKGEQNFSNETTSIASLNAGGSPIAVLVTRLNNDTKPDLVILREGQSAPSTIISAVLATINVDTTDDVISNDGACSLREAIINANNDDQSGSVDCAAGAGADVINVPAGTYTLTIGPFDDEFNLNGATEISGDLDVLNDDLTIVGAGPGSTIIEAGSNNTNGIDRVFDINNFAGPGIPLNFSLNDVTVRFGNAPTTVDGYFTPGGGIQCDGFDPSLPGSSGSCTLDNVVLDQNTASGVGGGILSIFGTLDIADSTISTNASINGSGGGIHYDGSADSNGQHLEITGSTITGNLTPNTSFGSGAGIRTGGGVSVNIDATDITLNLAGSNGGGISIENSPVIAISNGTINSNEASLNGGGVWSNAFDPNANVPSTISFSSVSVNSNKADRDINGSGDGGGIYNARGTMTFINGTIESNSAVHGGAVLNTLIPLSTAATFNRVGGTISFNDATLNGGGIAALAGTIVLDGTNIHGNFADTDTNNTGDGGAIYNNGATITGTNSLIGAGFNFNFARNGGGIANAAGTITLTDVTLGSNDASASGGCFAVTGGTVTLDDVTVEDGSAGTNGGGIALLNAGTVNLNNGVSIHRNNANQNGGGIYRTGGTLNMNGSITIGGSAIGDANSATNGGGIANVIGTLTMDGDRIAHNTATTDGGGIFNNGGTLNLTNMRLLNNSATSGGAIANNAGSTTVSLSRFFANTGAGSAIAQLGGTVTAENNWWACDSFPNGIGCQTVIGTVDSDPRIDLRFLAAPPAVAPNGSSTLTADVTQNTNGASLGVVSVLEGLPVTFASDALGSVLPTTGNILNGQAITTFTAGATTGESFPSVTLDNGTQTVSVWIVDTDCTLAPADDVNQLNTNHTVTATVVNGTTPIPSTSVDFDVLSGPNAGDGGTQTTNGSGQASFIYTGDGGVGVDSIQASGTPTFNGVAFPYSCAAQKEWVNVQAVLAPATDTNQINTQHTVTLTLTLNGNPVSVIPVTFNVTAGPNAGQNGNGNTDSNGQVSFTYTGGATTGIDTIQASGIVTVRGFAVPFATTATKEWVNVQATLTPSFDVNQINTDHTVTATVTLNGAAQSGITVNFNVSAGPNAGDNGTANTNASGQATFTWNGNSGIGTDTVQASGNVIVNSVSIPFLATAQKEWADIQFTLTPTSATNSVNTSHQVTATLSVNGVAQENVDVNFNVTSGPNSGDNGTDTTDSNGQATFSWTGDGGIGVDTVQASGSVIISGISVPFSATATKEWVDVQCTLLPSTDVNQVGTSHALTATVTNGPNPLSGVGVTFNVTSGPNNGTTGNDTTDVNGEANFSYVGGPLSGTDALQSIGAAVINGESFNFGCSATKQWVNVQATLTPTLDVNQINTQHIVTATVTLDGNPAPGVTVNFNITSGPNNGDSGSNTTDGNGQATFTWTGDGGTGTDAIQATGDVVILGVPIPFSASAQKQWVDVQATLTPTTDVNQVNTPHTVTATVTVNGAPSSGTTVNFNVTAGPNTGDNGTNTTDTNGQADFTYTGDGGAGTDTIQASGNVIISGIAVPFSATATKQWVVVLATLTPTTDVNPLNTQHTVTATISADGSPQQGVNVSFNVTAGPNTGDNGIVQTDSNGQASFAYPGDGGIGTDTIEASGTVIVNGVPVPFSVTAQKRWVVVQATLAPITDTNPVNTQHTVTATITLDGAPASGVTVNFNVTAGPNTGENGSNTTDTNGEAGFTYTGDGGIGVDTIEATGDVIVDGVPIPFNASASKEWVDVQCALDPATDTNPLGTDHTLTVTLSNGGNPLSGALVNFNVTAGPNSGDNGSGTTDGAGQTTFTYTGDGGIGTDTIEASGNAIINSLPFAFTCTAQKIWAQATATLTPANAVNQINTNHTVIATVLLNGSPAPAVPVSFTVTAGPNAGDGGVVVTDGIGEASFTYTGDGGTGTDTIQASGNVILNGVPIPFTTSAQKLWVDVQAVLTPATDTNQIGSDHTVTATLTVNGSPISGNQVNFDITAGPNAGNTSSGITDSSGQVLYVYTGDGGAGTDTIQASGTVLFSGMPVPFLATAQKTWIDLQCTVTPPTGSSEPGQQYSVTLTLTSDGVAQSGVPVNFAVTSGPNTGTNGVVVTDNNGQAVFAYTGNGGSGQDVIEASGTFNSVPFLCTATVTWCLFCDEFDDGLVDPNWTYQGNFSEDGESLIANSTRRARAIASPIFQGCGSNCSVEATIRTAGGPFNKVWLLAWYVSKKNTVELLMKEQSDRWVFKQKSNGVIVGKGSAQLQIDPNVFYTVRIQNNGQNFQVFIDGALQITVPITGNTSGTVGFRSKKTTARFGRILVE
jgi:hypothetical protein